MAIRSLRFANAREIQSARQFLKDPAFGAAQIGMRIALTSASPSDAVRQTNSFLSAVVEELADTLGRLKSERQQAPATVQHDIQDQIKDIDNEINQVKAQSQKLNEIVKKIEQLLPQMMAALGDKSKQPCNPTPQLIAVRTAELGQIIAGIEFAVESSAYPLPPDLDQLVKRFRLLALFDGKRNSCCVRSASARGLNGDAASCPAGA